MQLNRENTKEFMLQDSFCIEDKRGQRFTCETSRGCPLKMVPGKGREEGLPASLAVF